jgi:non-canonical purine NTP pyrophosphatase, rdgB/HAM1 family
MKEYVIATNNAHKVAEIEKELAGKVKLVTLKELGFRGDIAETSQTLQGNAEQKADFVYEKYHKNCFADDTGLEVEALGGRPGVYSARYAGEHCSFDDNIDKLLEELGSTTHRRAKFRTVICLIEEGKKYFFEGECKGTIALERYGKGGFGYDPIFFPDGGGESFAEMSMEAKNSISHRGKAIAKLAAHILKGC